eukprot:3599538-Rhodomonas_salina.1
MCAFVSRVPAGHHGLSPVPCLSMRRRYALLGSTSATSCIQVRSSAVVHGRTRCDLASRCLPCPSAVRKQPAMVSWTSGELHVSACEVADQRLSMSAFLAAVMTSASGSSEASHENVMPSMA